MRFGVGLMQYFQADDGAWSEVTRTEVADSQITVTDKEAVLMTTFFGRNQIHTGRVTLDLVKSLKTFYLYPTERPITLNLIFPKPNKPELRLYLNRRKGFKPQSSDIWFFYLKYNRLFLGHLKPADWEFVRSRRVSPVKA
jgi:5-methylcytosine-specific restriction enzyme A